MNFIWDVTLLHWSALGYKFEGTTVMVEDALWLSEACLANVEHMAGLKRTSKTALERSILIAQRALKCLRGAEFHSTPLYSGRIAKVINKHNGSVAKWAARL